MARQHSILQPVWEFRHMNIPLTMALPGNLQGRSRIFHREFLSSRYGTQMVALLFVLIRLGCPLFLPFHLWILPMYPAMIMSPERLKLILPVGFHLLSTALTEDLSFQQLTALHLLQQVIIV